MLYIKIHIYTCNETSFSMKVNRLKPQISLKIMDLQPILMVVGNKTKLDQL